MSNGKRSVSRSATTIGAERAIGVPSLTQEEALQHRARASRRDAADHPREAAERTVDLGDVDLKALGNLPLHNPHQIPNKGGVSAAPKTEALKLPPHASPEYHHEPSGQCRPQPQARGRRAHHGQGAHRTPRALRSTRSTRGPEAASTTAWARPADNAPPRRPSSCQSPRPSPPPSTRDRCQQLHSPRREGRIAGGTLAPPDRTYALNGRAFPLRDKLRLNSLGAAAGLKPSRILASSRRAHRQPRPMATRAKRRSRDEALARR